MGRCFIEKNVNIIFNNFMNTFPRIFCSSFPIKNHNILIIKKPWLTRGIRISCSNKRKLYLTYRKSNDPFFKECYKKYGWILSGVIMLAKKLYYNRRVLNSNNKSKTTWNIVKTITNNKNINNNISTMNIKGKLSSNPLAIANAFNTYFS